MNLAYKCNNVSYDNIINEISKSILIEMVIQKSNSSIDSNKNVAVLENTNGTWNFQSPAKIINIRTGTPVNMQTVRKTC